MPTPYSGTDYDETPSAGVKNIDALLYGFNWASTTVTFSFPTTGSVFSYPAGYTEGGSSESLSSGDKDAVRTALNAWANVSNLSFVEVADNGTLVGDLRFAYTDGNVLPNAQAWAYVPGDDPINGDVWISDTSSSYTEPWSLGSYEYSTILHEIGHALGFKHSFDDSAWKNGGVVLPKAFEGGSYTVMSYSAWKGDQNTYFSYDPTTPMVLDVAAIQYMYGADTSYNAGDTVYTYTEGASYHETLWDAGGTDTIVYASSIGGVIDLRQGIEYGSRVGAVVEVERYNTATGLFSTVGTVDNVWIAYGTVIENAKGGGGNDTIFGNEADNRLEGAGGRDAMMGGLGDDTYDVNLIVSGSGAKAIAKLEDTVTEKAGEGEDTIVLHGAVTLIKPTTITLGANIENLDASDTDSTPLNLTGNSLGNELTGNDADNILDGKAGADTLVGGLGDDTYILDNPLDVVEENIGEGVDTVKVAIATPSGSYSLVGTFVENVTLSNAVAFDLEGNDEDNVLIGNAFANTLEGGLGDDALYGLAGNDILVGGNGSDLLDGGLGADTMRGGAGDDIYIVDSIADTVDEEGNADTNDRIQSSISIDLSSASYNDIESVTLTGTSALSAIGDAFDNTLIGNSGNNVLNGGGGEDVLEGGKGNDIYHVDDINDTVTEAAAEGTDTIISEITYDLSVDTANVENLTLAVGAGDINGTGNSVANNLIGNEGDNELSGGDGNDTLIGGAGDDILSGDAGIDILKGGADNDTYNIDLKSTGSSAKQVLTLEDSVSEALNEGNDTIVVLNPAAPIVLVKASTLVLGANIENLDISQTGSTKLNLTGNALINILTGNDADNILSGGAGADTLIGGGGDDTYIIDNLADALEENAAEGIDTVKVAIAAAGGTYTLAANVENGTLTNKVAFNLTGNDEDNILIGNAAANILDGGVGADTLVGGAGNDTYIVDDAGDAISEATTGGIDTVESSIAYSLLGTNLENVTLTGAANIDATGNALVNVLRGNIGINTLTGGAGNDTYYIGIDDTVTEAAAEGTDTIVSEITYDLSVDTANVENLTLATGAGNIDGTGNSVANGIIGNEGNNELSGGGGNDTLIGGAGNDILIGGAGVDLLKGGADDDTYNIDLKSIGSGAKQVLALEDSATEALNEGNDTIVVLNPAAPIVLIKASTLVLGANIENLDISQTSTTKLNLMGNTLSNALTGNQADNTLDGKAGADTLIGGDGDDTYLVDNLGDVVEENAAEGTDSVKIGIAAAGGTYVLAANVENGTLTNKVAFNLTGNDEDNILIGNAAANILDGGAGDDVLNGGAGKDVLKGGAGDDTYIVDNAGDIVDEEANVDTCDTIQSSISINLTKLLVDGVTLQYSGVENVTLTGSAALNATGDAADNELIGNAGNNILDGGLGADRLEGGKGNDTYHVDNFDDDLVEANGEGTDLVISKIDYTLFDDFENLTLALGAGDIDGTGNTVANIIIGNDGHNVLSGGGGKDTLSGGAGDDTLDGGADADTLKGGMGNDTYVVNLAQLGSNPVTATVKLEDTVSESANEGIDTLELQGDFSGLVSTTTLVLGGNLENLDASATGATKLNLNGNTLANTLIGNDANNILNGGAGADTLIGGLGDDTYVLDSIGDTLTEAFGEGNDTIRIGFTGVTGTMISLLDYDNIENITLTSASAFNLEGNALDNVLIGNAAANTLIGADGDDTLNGGAGADTLLGGEGNDTYVIDNVGDTIDEEGNADTDDLVQSSLAIDLTLAAFDGIEHVTLMGSANINATGDADGNILTGNSGNNVLDGGAGADLLIGGEGSDTYVIDDDNDVIDEAGVGDTDTVKINLATVGGSYILGTNLENAELINTVDFDLTGNSLNNKLTGNAADNIIVGGLGNDILDAGTGGVDALYGGAGNDTYIVSHAGVTIDEEGNLDADDSIEASVSVSLGSYIGIENVRLTGTAALNATGNVADNQLIGNDGNNILDGGTGADDMRGGKGNDTYVVDNVGDRLVEAVNAGTDLVQSSISYTLLANFENLTLLGSGHTNATGNGGSNILIGNSGNNILDGKAGADDMSGGGGDDIYILDNFGDIIRESAGQGTDLIKVSVAQSGMLSIESSYIENVTLINAVVFNVTGNSLDNVLTGNEAENELVGGAGEDTLFGGGGRDVLSGGDGNDRLIGGSGIDEMTGGAGADTFVFDDASDLKNVIVDFDFSNDMIELDSDSFDALTAGPLDGSMFAIDTPAYLMYHSLTGGLYYDADGGGAGAAVLIASFSNHASLSISEANFVVS